jgi:CheY-like chemotaxis protein
MNIKKALVVDDSKVAHLTLRRLLTERNVEVDWVGSGEDAIAYMEKQHPDIIFMDVMMPGIDGFEATAAIINNPAIAAPPVVLCSANATDGDRQNAKASGAIEFLSKPYTPAELDNILEKVHALPEPAGLPAAGPSPQTVTVPVLEQTGLLAGAPAAVDTTYVERIAERAAWAMADKVAREIAAEIAKDRAEQTVHAVVEQAAYGLLEEAVHRATEAAVQLAQGSVRSIAADTALRTATEVIQANIGQAVRTATEPVVREISEDVVKKQLTRGLIIIRDDLTKHLEQQLQPAVQDTLAGILTNQEFKQQLAQMVKETTLPLATSLAATTEVSQEAMNAVEECGKQARLALIIAIVALLGAIGAVLGHLLH